MHEILRKRFPSELQRDKLYFMSHAYNQALLAWEKGEVPIGAVIEKEGQIIAYAHNQTRGTNDPTAHAEIIAISKASSNIGDWRLNECTLYVTKEPCPMCSGALVMARIGRVYYGLRDSAMGCLGGATDLSNLPKSNHKFKATGGILESECHALLNFFFENKRENKKDSIDK